MSLFKDAELHETVSDMSVELVNLQCEIVSLKSAVTELRNDIHQLRIKQAESAEPIRGKSYVFPFRRSSG